MAFCDSVIEYMDAFDDFICSYNENDNFFCREFIRDKICIRLNGLMKYLIKISNGNWRIRLTI